MTLVSPALFLDARRLQGAREGTRLALGLLVKWSRYLQGRYTYNTIDYTCEHIISSCTYNIIDHAYDHLIS